MSGNLPIMGMLAHLQGPKAARFADIELIYYAF